MSQHVRKREKAFRIVIVSAYLALIVGFSALYFANSTDMIFVAFGISWLYFMIILLALTVTNQIHYAVLVKRKDVKSEYTTQYMPIDNKSVKVAYLLSVVLFIALIVLSIVRGLLAHAFGLLLILLFMIFYFAYHKIMIYFTKEGIVYDYGEFLTLFRWDEIPRYSIKSGELLIFIENKNIRRKIPIDDKKKVVSIIKKYHLAKLRRKPRRI